MTGETQVNFGRENFEKTADTFGRRHCAAFTMSNTVANTPVLLDEGDEFDAVLASAAVEA